MFAAVAEIFRNGSGDQGSTNADERWLVGCRHDDDGPGPYFRREIAFQEFFDFPSPLPTRAITRTSACV